MPRRFTLMFTGKGRSAARELGGPAIWISSVLILFCWTLVVWSFGATYVAAVFGIGEMARAERNNSALRLQLAEADLLADKLRSQMADLTAREQSARMVVGLPDVHPDIRQLGIGGREEIAFESAFSDSLLAQHVQVVSSKLEKLHRQVRLETASLRAITRKAQEDQHYWRYMPTVKPVKGYDASPFGPRNDPFNGLPRMHRGYDIAAEKDESVMATADGTVIRTGVDKAYGRYVDIDHLNGFMTRYAHLSSIVVKKRTQVLRGDLIGYVGDTGRATGYHVHYEVRRYGRALDPIQFFYPENRVVD